MNSRVCRFRVASECASIETRSKVGGASARASHNLRKYSPIFIISSKRSSSECTTASGESTLAIATSDHQLSFMRSSQGKSNSVASIMLVRSVETRSAQSKVSLRGKRIQHIRGPLADQRLEIGEVGRRHDRCDGASLGGMAGRVHADEDCAIPGPSAGRSPEYRRVPNSTNSSRDRVRPRRCRRSASPTNKARTARPRNNARDRRGAVAQTAAARCRPDRGGDR